MVTSMTCFTGSFAQSRGLGEVVLTESPTGAIGWFGSSGVGWIINDYLMVQPLFTRMLGEDGTLGELVDAARMDYFAIGFDYLRTSMLFQYNLLGDPSIRLKRPESTEAIHSAETIYDPSEQLVFNWSSQSPAILHYLPIDAENQPWYTRSAQFEIDGNGQLLVNQASNPPACVSRLAYTLDRGPDLPALQGSVDYSIHSDWFEHTEISQGDSGRTDFHVRFHTRTLSIDSLFVVLSGGVQERLKLVAQDEGWALEDPREFRASDQTIRYQFTVYSGGNPVRESPLYTLHLMAPMSLTIRGIDQAVQEDRCGYELTYEFESQGSVEARVSWQAGGSADSLEGMIHPGLNTFFLPAFLGDRAVEVTVGMRVNGSATPLGSSMSTVVKPLYYQVLPELGISFDGQSRDSLTVWDGKLFVSEAGQMSWLMIRTDSLDHTPAGITPLQDSTLYDLNASAPLSLGIQQDLTVLARLGDRPVWRVTEGGGFTFDGKSQLMLAQINDRSAPETSMMIGGQMFFDGDYILEDSEIHIFAEDDQGFAWDPRHIQLSVDDEALELSLSDTAETGQVMGVRSQLDLSEGTHLISYAVADALGNWSDVVSVEAVVAGEAEIIDYGNFPNPFEGETLIIYELTQPLDEVTIDIFTISGYRCQRIDTFSARVSIPLGAIGYHEIPWNGRDALDRFVANGVYFYRVQGEIDGKTIYGQVGKMVKNR